MSGLAKRLATCLARKRLTDFATQLVTQRPTDLMTHFDREKVSRLVMQLAIAGSVDLVTPL